MNVLVTGGAGFVGSHVVDELIDADHRVVVVDNLQSGDKRNINPEAVFYDNDIRTDDLEKIFKEESIDAVCHLAAKTNMRESLDDPISDADTNVVGLLRTLEACRHTGVNTFVFSSTGGALYGDTELLPTPESVPPQPLSPYGITKMAGERYGFFYTNTHGLNFTVLRYSNIYGPRLERKANVGSAVFNTMRTLREESQPEIRGDGEQTRDFIYVKDVARANLLAVEKANGYNVFNVGSGVETSVNSLVETVANLVDVEAKPSYVPAITGEVTRSSLNITAAKEILDWVPEYTLEKGLKEMLNK